MTKKDSLKNKLFTSGLILSSFSAYYRQANAACVSANNDGVYICSQETSETQHINFDNQTDINITTSDDFSFNGPLKAFAINTLGSVSFTDQHNSNITVASIGGDYGIDAFAGFHNSGESITINSNSNLDLDNEGSYFLSGGIRVTNRDNNGNTEINFSGRIAANSFGINVNSNSQTSITLEESGVIDLTNENAMSSNSGIIVTSFGEDLATNVTIRGDINVKGNGIRIYSYQDTTVRVENGGSISGNTAMFFGYDTQATVILDGRESAISIAGDNENEGRAIRFGNQNDNLRIFGDVTINGDVNFGNGADTLVLDGANLTLSDDSQFLNFEEVETNSSVINGNLNLGNANITPEDNSDLKINGELTANSIILANGASLSGNASLNTNVIVNSGGIIAPGNSPGEVIVNGNVNFNNGAIFNAEIDRSGVDKLTVNGNVTIANNVTLNIIPTNLTSGSATILQVNGGALTGSFSNINVSQGNIATTYNPSANSIAVISLNSKVLDATLQSANNNSILFSDILNDQLALNNFNDKHFWTRAIYRNRNVSSNENGVGLQNESSGIAFGLSKKIDENYNIGFSFAQIFGKNNLQNDSASVRTNSSFATIYGNFKKQLNNKIKLFSSLAFGLGYHDNSTSRLVYNDEIATNAQFDNGGYEYNFNLQFGANLKFLDSYFFMPKFSASYINNFSKNFQEENAGAANIKINDFSFSTLKLRQAVRFGKEEINFSKLNLSPFLEFGLSQERGFGSAKIKGNFSNNSAFSFKLQNQNQNFITSAIGLNAQFNQDISGIISFENSNNKNENRNEGRLLINVKF